MSNTLIIGLGHKARHGKDTMAAHLKALLPYDIKLYSFASDLKAWCRVQGYMDKKNGPLLQLVGTELFRQFVDPDFWVKSVADQIADDEPKIAIVTDVRFKNEAAWIQNQKGILCKVQRLTESGIPFSDAGRDPTHLSETDLDSFHWDYTFTNYSGDLQGLKKDAENFINVILPRRLG